MLKSCLDPVQIGHWLGFILDLEVGSFRVPDDQISKSTSAIRSIPMKVQVCLLASIAGQIISMSLAVGPVAPVAQGIVCHKSVLLLAR